MTATAETRVYGPTVSGPTVRYETDYRFTKRDFGGWAIVLDANDVDLGWVTKNPDTAEWTLWVCEAGEIEGLHKGIFTTRDDAAHELIWLILNRHVNADPRRDPVIDRDKRDRHELTERASRTVDAFAWERPVKCREGCGEPATTPDGRCAFCAGITAPPSSVWMGVGS